MSSTTSVPRAPDGSLPGHSVTHDDRAAPATRRCTLASITPSPHCLTSASSPTQQLALAGRERKRFIGHSDCPPAPGSVAPRSLAKED